MSSGKFKRCTEERPNRGADCERQAILYRIMRDQRKKPKPLKTDEDRLAMYQKYWTKCGQYAVEKPLDETKAYLIVRFSMGISDPQKLTETRQFLARHAGISYEYLMSEITSKYKNKRLFDIATANAPLPKRRRRLAAPTEPPVSHKPIEVVQLITPVYFSEGTPYNSLKCFAQ